MTQDELTKLINEFLPYPSKGQHYALRQFATIVADAEREACAFIAFNGCLVPPDGGSPTEAERLMCEDIATAIRARNSV